jgi:hypothetical protein
MHSAMAVSLKYYQLWSKVYSFCVTDHLLLYAATEGKVIVNMWGNNIVFAVIREGTDDWQASILDLPKKIELH